jgi:hypothetical protein
VVSNWEGPYKIEEVIAGNSYMVRSIQETSLPRAFNGKYLKMADNDIIALSTNMTDETP